MANETIIVVHPFRDYHAELEPIGMGKLMARACEGNSNYTDFMNPVFRRVPKA